MNQSRFVANDSKDEADDGANNILTTTNGLKAEVPNELQSNTEKRSPRYDCTVCNEIQASTNALINSINEERQLNYQAPEEPQKQASSSISSVSLSPAHAVIVPLPGITDADRLSCVYNVQLLDWSKKNIVAVGLERSVKLWDPFKGAVWNCFKQNDCIRALVWHKNGCSLAVGTSSGEVQIWNADSAILEEILVGPNQPISALAWQGDVLYAGSIDGRILKWKLAYAWDVPSCLRGHTKEICSLQWSPNGKYMASSANDNKVLIWTDESDKPLHVFTGHKGPVQGLAWSPSNYQLLASGGGKDDKSLRIWNVLTGTCVQIVDTGYEITKLVWSPKSNKLITTHVGKVTPAFPDVAFWHYPSMKQQKYSLGTKDGVFDLVVSPDGEHILIGSPDGSQYLLSVYRM